MVAVLVRYAIGRSDNHACPTLNLTRTTLFVRIYVMDKIPLPIHKGLDVQTSISLDDDFDCALRYGNGRDPYAAALVCD